MTEMPASRKAAVWLALIFLLGGTLGAVFGFAMGSHRAQVSASDKKTPEARRADIVERLTQELSLTEAQRKSLDPLLAEFQGKIQVIHKQFEPQMNELRESTRKKIRALLTPEQQTKYEEHVKRVDEERKNAGY
ncbi:MAG: hypothetical protein LAN71_13465 [Acidobacteriia bacterium]|nr:hypothetical protein [Terriglobia bacterium]